MFVEYDYFAISVFESSADGAMRCELPGRRLPVKSLKQCVKIYIYEDFDSCVLLQFFSVEIGGVTEEGLPDNHRTYPFSHYVGFAGLHLIPLSAL